MTLLLVLLSGGLDSTTAAYRYASRGHELITLSFDYEQRHRIELDAARRIAARLGVIEHVVVRLDMRYLVGNPLTGIGRASVPVDRPSESASTAATFVPGRNTIFLATALSLAESRGAEGIVIGASRDDFSGYPDCREDYLAAFDTMASLAVGNGSSLRILRPFVHWRKSSVVEAADALKVPIAETWSCYMGADGADARQCGRCDACRVRRQAFIQARVADPTEYA